MLERRERSSRRRLHAARVRVGRAARASGPLDEKFGAHVDVTLVDDAERRLAHWRRRLDTSLEQDRADYAIVGGLGRWLVVARGMLDRFVVRERVRFIEREIDDRESELGARLVERMDGELLARVSAADVEDARGALSDADAAAQERDALLAPYHGDPWPAGLRELRSFGRFLWRELRPKLIPRAPAIVGLIAGWWIAQSFSDSWFDDAKSRFGLGSKTSVSTGALETIRFWGPLVAAALCAYLGAFLSSRVHRRYSESTAKSDAKS